MAAKKFLRLVSGVFTEVFGVQSSAGAGNAGDIVSLDDTGKIDATMLPVGVGADVVLLTATEALNAGDWVNIHSGGVRKADATTAGKEADGFVLAAVANTATASVYKEGTNTQLTGLTLGATLYLSTTPGLASATAPSGNGNVLQRVGKAISTTSADWERGEPVTLVA